MATKSTTGVSNGMRSLITWLLLIFLLPVGVIVMWVWTKWSTTSKWILTIIAVPGFFFWLSFTGIVIAIFSQPNR